MSDNDLIRRGSVLEILDCEGWIGNTLKLVNALPAAQPSPDVAALVAERDELRAKLGAAVDALGYYAVQALSSDTDDSLFARAALARVKGGEA